MRCMGGVLLAFALVACGGPLADAKADFDKGHFAAAKQALLRDEVESRTWSDRERAEYALYRGLTHGALGDRAAAALWLREAKALEDTRPGTLTAGDLTRLERALESSDPSRAAGAP